MKLLGDIHQHYRRTCRNPVKRPTYFKVVDRYMRFFINLIYTGKRVRIPAGLGSFIFVGKKQNVRIDENGDVQGAPIDWGETRKLWNVDDEARKNKQLVYHLNEHTDGYVYKLRWSYKRGMGKYKLLYVFKPSRRMKLTFAKLLKENTYEYETQE